MKLRLTAGFCLFLLAAGAPPLCAQEPVEIGQAMMPYRIVQPGRYAVIEDLRVPTGTNHGITVAADNEWGIRVEGGGNKVEGNVAVRNRKEDYVIPEGNDVDSILPEDKP